jgi:hypothetical protein
MTIIMTPRTCPLCDVVQNSDQAAFEYHVNSHLQDERSAPLTLSAGTAQIGRERSPFDDDHAADDG